MEVFCPVSIGELVDKMSILEIKTRRIQNEEKVNHARTEWEALNEILSGLNVNVGSEYGELIEINGRLWDIEDELRVKEKERDFEQSFVELARAVYKTNDQRFGIKNKINQKYGSILKEVKSYC